MNRPIRTTESPIKRIRTTESLVRHIDPAEVAKASVPSPRAIRSHTSVH